MAKRHMKLDVAIPQQVYTQLHALAGARGVSMNDVVVEALEGQQQTAPAKPDVAFLASIPKPIHSALKHKAEQQGRSMRALINEACAKAVGLEIQR